jgi:DNA primase large subunit
MDFFRDEARPDRVRDLAPFWYRDAPDQGYGLLVRAMARARGLQDESASAPREITWDADAAPEEAFPPTFTKMLAGMTDGKKRGLFILTNFLASVGWNADMIEERLLRWNQANPEPIREGDIRNHIRYFKQKNQKVLPPNFANPIYKDLGVLVEDELTRSPRVKNPVQYVRLRLKQAGPAKV